VIESRAKRTALPSAADTFNFRILRVDASLALADPYTILVPNHRERQIMQDLRDRGWVKAIELPEAPGILKRLLERRWIERQGNGRNLAYRITAEGMAAKTAPLRV
jgi:predicted MarR family transcription regulator